MHNIKLIIFDLDGTLIDAYRAIIISFNYAMVKSGYPTQSDRAIRRAVGWGDEKLIAPFVQKKDLKKVLALYRSHHKTSLLKYSTLMPGAKQLLSQLKEKYLIAVASNRPTKFSKILLGHLGLTKYFDYMLCADKLKSGKPHPAILNKILRKFSLKPQEALYVGDMTIDAQAGRRAHIKTIIITGGSSTKAQIRRQRPWKIISRLAALTRLLLQGKISL